MAEKQLTSESKFSLSIKELIGAAIGFSSLIGMYFTLQADIARAMELPQPEVQKIEFDYKYADVEEYTDRDEWIAALEAYGVDTDDIPKK